MVDLICLRDHYALCSESKEDAASDVDDSVLEVPAFGYDVSPKQSSDTSNIAVRHNPTNNEEYENYVSIIDDEFSDECEDPELLQAIEASLAEPEHSCTPAQDESNNVTTLLSSFQISNLDHTESETNGNIIISRKAIFTSARRATERGKFSFLKPVVVTFAGEEAVDEGGPKHEFFRLLMRDVSQSSVFHGSWFSHDLDLLANNRYHFAGKLVAWSILQGGCGLGCMSNVGFDLQRDVPVNHEAAIESVADHEMKKILTEAAKCSTEERFSTLVEEYGDKIAQYGYPKIYTCKLSDRDEMVMSLLKQYFVYGVNAEVTQFFQGLNSIGNLGDLIMENKPIFDTVLGNQHPHLTKAMFMSLYELERSEEGSNKRDKEDSTVYCFELFLQDLEEGELAGLTLQGLLVFVSGADCVPPLGFDKLITIAFYDFEENTRRRPYASTCGLYLFLPRGFENPSDFSNFMKEALLDCHGFGKG